MNVRGANLTIGLALLVAFQTVLHAQNYGTRLGVQRGGEVSFEPRGPGVLFGALDPAIQKWYVPQELYYEFRWRQWEYSNYARDQYQRYINTNLEGDYFYDFFRQLYQSRLAGVRLAPRSASRVGQRYLQGPSIRAVLQFGDRKRRL